MYENRSATESRLDIYLFECQARCPDGIHLTTTASKLSVLYLLLLSFLWSPDSRTLDGQDRLMGCEVRSLLRRQPALEFG